jgi:hypothetical protein
MKLFAKELLIVALLYFMLFSVHAQQGCFITGFQKKTATKPPYIEHLQELKTLPSVFIDVDHRDTIAEVSKYVYGNNVNPYMTQIVTQAVLLDDIKKLSPNIIRCPGGSLSDVYFWNSANNAPPSDVPSKLLDSNGNPYDAAYWYGKNTASWTLCLDNYYSMLQQTGNTGMITVNYAYARYGTGPAPANTAAHYAADWVRYDNGRTKFWEIGNENDGNWEAGYWIDTTMNKDGQPRIITGELYGEHFNIFADSMRAAAAKLGFQIFIGAQILPYDASNSWNPVDITWNKGLFSKAGNNADFFIVHDYYTPYNENSTPDVILNTGQAETDTVMNYMKSYASSNGIDMKPIALTEWNIRAVGSKQDCSFINGIHSALVLGELIKQGYGEASRWDLANGYSNGDDQGIFNNCDEPGVPDWNPRPAFFYMYYFQKYFGDHMIKSTVTGSQDIISYASTFTSGETGIVIVNKGTDYASIKLNMPYFGYGDRYYMYSLTGGTDNGEFSQVVYVNGNGPDYLTGGPVNNLVTLKAWSDAISGTIYVSSPPRSVQYILVENGNNTINDVENPVKTVQMIYPNPATNKISIISAYPLKKVEIISCSGEVVKTVTLDSVSEISISLAPGIYFVKTYHSGGASVTKLLILRK